MSIIKLLHGQNSTTFSNKYVVVINNKLDHSTCEKKRKLLEKIKAVSLFKNNKKSLRKNMRFDV